VKQGELNISTLLQQALTPAGREKIKNSEPAARRLYKLLQANMVALEILSYQPKTNNNRTTREKGNKTKGKEIDHDEENEEENKNHHNGNNNDIELIIDLPSIQSILQLFNGMCAKQKQTLFSKTCAELIYQEYGSTDTDLPIASLVSYVTMPEIQKVAQQLLSTIFQENFRALEILENELFMLIGLRSIKQRLRQFFKRLVYMRLLRITSQTQVNLSCSFAKTSQPYHCLFVGAPGVGKTTVARLMGRLLKGFQMLSKGHLVEVQRGDLVAKYVGQTAPKTRKKIEEAKGGVLFVDEVYRLVSSSGSHDFGQEAIEELMCHMNDQDICMIFAGYPAPIKGFIDINAGLYRRITERFDFENYTPEDLARVLVKKVTAKQYKLHSELSLSVLTQFIKTATTETQRSRMNAGLVDLLVDGAINTQLPARLDLHPSKSALTTIVLSDLQKAASLLQR
jgi:adenylate kinase family enzyme